jgi:hypothetical protein
MGRGRTRTNAEMSNALNACNASHRMGDHEDRPYDAMVAIEGIGATPIMASGRILYSPTLEPMPEIVGDSRDRPCDALADIGRIGHVMLAPSPDGTL